LLIGWLGNERAVTVDEKEFLGNVHECS
jgi:hypothetical protein